MNIRFFGLLPFMLITTASVSTNAYSQSDGQDMSAILVLDSSGSMWAKIGEDTKVSIARNVIDDMVDNWDENTPLGLMTYGHRRKGDCTDIELLLPATTVNKTVFKKEVRGLNPTGKTPMVQSVLNAAESLAYEDMKATVILVSDGEETCGLDPCTIGASLQEKGIDFTAHVIGFDVSLEESTGLKCLADKTGGRYLSAENAEELSDALKTVAEDTTTAEIEKEGKATVNAIQDEVIAGKKIKVEWTGPKNRRDRLVVFSLDGETRYEDHYINEDVEPTLELIVPETPGIYEVHYYTRHTKSLAFDTFTVIAAQALVKAPKTPIVGGTSFKVEVSEPERSTDRLRTVNSDGKRVTNRNPIYIQSRLKDGFLEVIAPETAGDYTVEYITRGNKVLAKDSFSVRAPSASLKTSKMPIQGGTKFKVEVSQPERPGDQLRVLDHTGKDVTDESVIYVRNGFKDGKVEIMSPETAGEYTIEYFTRAGKVLAEDSFTVVAATGELDAPDGPVVMGKKISIKVSEPNQNSDRIRFMNESGVRVGSSTYYITIYYKDGIVEIPAPKAPGVYEVQYITRGKKVLASDTLTVTAP